MPRRASGPKAVLFLALSIFWTGCGTSHVICPSTSNSACSCGSGSEACPADFIPLLYATTTSNQVLGFTINSSGALTAPTSIAGPANSKSIALLDNALEFADTATNSVDGFAINLVSGSMTPIQGSPFSLGSPTGGPTDIVAGANLYATEPNGTIVGLTRGGEVGEFSSPLPNSPYAAGVAPSQMTLVPQGTLGDFFLYASDPGDASGGILAYSTDSSGSLTPIQGSPFSTLPNASPAFILSSPYYSSQGTQGTLFLFVSLTSAAKVAVFSIDSSTGALTQAPGSPFAVGNGPGGIAADQSNHVYVMNATDHTVSAFNLGSNGVLTAIGSPVPVGTASGGMALGNTFTAEELFVADTTASTIWTLNVDSTTGALTAAGQPLAVSSPPLQLVLVEP